MVDFAVCTGIGIYGSVLFFLGGSSYDLYVFLVIALAGLAIYFPRYSRWEEWMHGQPSVGPGPHAPSPPGT